VGHIGPKKPGFSEKAGLLNSKLIHDTIIPIVADYVENEHTENILKHTEK